MGHLLHNEPHLPDQHVIMRVSHSQQLWPTLNFYVTHVIFVILVDEFIMYISLSNQIRILPLGPH